jgi:hypothetical protein
MEIKSIYDLTTYESMVGRINQLTSESQPQWGKMSVGQMLAHCAEVQDVSNGKPLKGTPWFINLIGGFVKKMVLNKDPYPKNIRTHPQYLTTEPEDFETQKERLLLSLKAMIALGKISSRHPIFGEMTPDEKGWGMYKHLDHHLGQFGV